MSSFRFTETLFNVLVLLLSADFTRLRFFPHVGPFILQGCILVPDLPSRTSWQVRWFFDARCISRSHVEPCSTHLPKIGNARHTKAKLLLPVELIFRRSGQALR